MGDKIQIRQEIHDEERAFFGRNGLQIYDTVFLGGESPIKECRDIEIYNSMFKWKYPIWYSQNITVKDCALFEAARAGIWYTDNITVERTMIESPKNFRRCKGVYLKDVTFTGGAETLWDCSGVSLDNVRAKGDYFAMNSKDMRVSGLRLSGNYCFDGVRNVEICDSVFLGRDLFWNSEAVTVRDSFISGAYLGWNSKNLTLVNCTVESLQGMCYIDSLVMKNCKLVNTTLAFEYSTVEADITGRIDSVLNPEGGTITADSIGELTLEKDRIDPSKTKIVCRDSTIPA